MGPRIRNSRRFRALLRLGGRRPQTATLGLVDVELTPRGRLLLGRGDPLGLFAESSLTPAAVLIPPEAEAELMLGSDGLFAKGIRDAGRELAERGDADDRSLIHVRIDRAA